MKIKILAVFMVLFLLAGCATAENTALEGSNTASLDAPGAVPTATPIPTLLNLPVATSLSTPTAAPVGETNSPDRCNNPYYPVVNGATWVYEIEGAGQTTYTMSTGEDGSFTITIASENATFYMDGQCTEDGIILVDRGQDLQYQSEDGGSTVSSQVVEGVTLPDDIQVGDDWVQVYVLNAVSGDQSLESTITTNYIAAAYESVSVPAGNLMALRIDQTGTMNMNGQEFPTGGSSWYVDGIGVVKSATGIGGETQAVGQLLSYNIP